MEEEDWGAASTELAPPSTGPGSSTHQAAQEELPSHLLCGICLSGEQVGGREHR